MVMNIVLIVSVVTSMKAICSFIVFHKLHNKDIFLSFESTRMGKDLIFFVWLVLLMEKMHEH